MITLIKSLLNKEIKVLISILIIVFGALIFILIASEVTSNSTAKFDGNVIRSLREAGNYSQPKAPEWVTIAMTDITALGSGTVLLLFTLAVIGFLILQNQYNAIWLIAAATISGALITLGLKELFERARPDLIYRLVNVNSVSFPSGHSAMSAVVYLTQSSLLARIQKKRSARIYILTTALVLTLLIGLSRVYLGVHYPTDVLAGWSFGLAWASFCWFIAWYLERKNKLEKISAHD